MYEIGFVSLAVLVLFSFSLVNFYWWYQETMTGRATQQPLNFTIVVQSEDAPSIIISPIADVSPVEEDPVDVVFYVQMVDPYTVDDLNTDSVAANFTYGAVTRGNDSCVHLGNLDAYTANFSCTIRMWYWDTVAAWEIHVLGSNSYGAGSNTSETFNYNQLVALKTSPPQLTWTTVQPGALNQTSNNDPLIINNTGNYDGNITITAIDLIGEEDDTHIIPAANFSIGLSTGDSAECGGTRMVNGTEIDVVSSDSNPGNLSAGGGAGQENFYYCIVQIPLIKSQTYSTEEGGSWLTQFVSF